MKWKLLRLPHGGAELLRVVIPERLKAVRLPGQAISQNAFDLVESQANDRLLVFTKILGQFYVRRVIIRSMVFKPFQN